MQHSKIINKIVPFLVGVVTTLFLGCSSSSVKNPSIQPSWILNPYSEGKHGAVGVAGRTYQQTISSQRKLAITRALDELSLQTKVEVKLLMQKKESSTKNRSSFNLEEHSSYKTNSTLSAHIEDVWLDQNSHEIYIWMVLNK